MNSPAPHCPSRFRRCFAVFLLGSALSGTALRMEAAESPARQVAGDGYLIGSFTEVAGPKSLEIWFYRIQTGPIR